MSGRAGAVLRPRLSITVGGPPTGVADTAASITPGDGRDRIAGLNLNAGAAAPCPLVCCKFASYSASKARRSGPAAMATFEG